MSHGVAGVDRKTGCELLIPTQVDNREHCGSRGAQDTQPGGTVKQIGLQTTMGWEGIDV